MKTFFLTVFVAMLLLLAGRNAQAQVYDLYYYWDGAQYEQYYPQAPELYSYGYANQYPEQLYDPYYELHVIHYQLYLPQYQPYYYAPCCVGGAVVVPPVVVPAVPVQRFPGRLPRAARPLPLPPLPPAVTAHSAAAIRIR